MRLLFFGHDLCQPCRPMKILHVNFAKGFRGGERQTVALIRALAALPEITHQTVLMRHDSPMREALVGLDGVSCLHSRKPHWRAISTCPEVDLVHAHEAKAVKWAWLHARLRGIPYLVTRRIIKSPKQKWLTHKAYSGARKTVAVSHYVADVMATYLQSDDVAVIPDSVASLPFDQQEAAALRAPYSGKFLIGHVGALVDADKGQATLIEAARLAAERRLNYQFFLLGAGADAQRLQTQAKARQNVTFLGFQTNVGTWLRVFDVFAFPSRQEGLGSSILDAMEARCPVVASDVGGIPDIVRDGETGCLVPPDDAEALLTAITALEENVDRRSHYIEGALRHLEGFQPSAVAERYRKIYSQALA